MNALPEFPEALEVSSLDDVRRLFTGRLDTRHATNIEDAGAVAAMRSASNAGLEDAKLAVRAGRLIEFGEIELPCFDTRPTGAAPPFGGDSTAYTFTHQKNGRAIRLLLVDAPRMRTLGAFEIIMDGDKPAALWVASVAADGRALAREPALQGMAQAGLGPALWRLTAASRIERIAAPFEENRRRRARGLPPVPGYFKATLPLPETLPRTGEAGQGLHASPVPHLRCGHQRKLPSGRVVPVRPCAIRGGPGGLGQNFHSNQKGQAV